MDNDAQQQNTAPQAAEPAQEPQKSFDQLSDAEQQDVLRSAFFGDMEETDDEDGEGENNAGTGDSSDGAAQAQQPAAQQQAPKDLAEGTPAGEAPALYTPEEFLLLSPDEVDAARLPDAARIVHERDMRYFNETIRPQLEELKALKAQRAQQNALRQPEQQPQNSAPDLSEFNKAVKQEAARRLGVENLDEFNADHNIMVSLVAGEFQRAAFEQQAQIRNQQAQLQYAQQNYARMMNELSQEYGSDFAVIDRWALSEMNNLPFGVANQVVSILRSGDPEKIKNVYKQFAERYKASKSAPAVQPTAQQKTVEAPPKLISGSGNDGGSTSGWGIKEFRNADSQAKTRMIEEMFFSKK